MAYLKLGLATAIVSAIRTAVADPALVEQVGDNASKIGDVRERLDEMVERLSGVELSDASQAETISGIVGELTELADALAGPADDDEDNGALAEVEPIEEAPTSAAADSFDDSPPE